MVTEFKVKPFQYRVVKVLFAGIYLLSRHPASFADPFDPTALSIEQLMESQVSSVSKTEQRFSDSAAAVTILTQDDIQRSGVTNIPDALRMVPGIQVARISTSQWAVTARGFNGRFANKLLVLLDGRAVYTPTFGGVRWENLDLVLEDIERIEVIRGPGASVWGQNAVNGVINIITKHTEDTQEGLATVTAGKEENAIVELRYGDQISHNAHYRVFGKFLHRDDLADLNGASEHGDWTQGRGGFRMDWNSNEGDQLLVEADGYIGETEKDFLLPTDNPLGPPRQNWQQNSGASVLARWDHDFSVASKTSTQFYFEYYNEEEDDFGSERQYTYDLDFQHDIAVTKDNYFNWGLGYRFVDDTVNDSRFATVTPSQKDLHLFSAFIQDKAVFFNDTLHFTFGTKVQYYTFTGWDYQPSARLLWKFHPEHRLWLSFSRATRAPSRGETALNLNPLPIPGPIPFNFGFRGNPDLDNERVLTYELGYRGWQGNRLSVDMTVFYNDYESLITGLDLPVDFSNRFIGVTFENGARAQTWGFETATDWRPIDSLRLQLSYSLLKVNYQNFNFSQQDRPRTDPVNQLSFRGSYDITSSIAFDIWVRYVDSISAVNTLFSPSRDVPGYVGLDLRLAWKPLQNIELSVVGQNLNNKEHLEFVEEVFAYPKQLERSVYGKILWKF